MGSRSENRLAELILYIAQCCEGDPTFGTTKLAQIVFFADFGVYRQTGRSITDQSYRKGPSGPIGSDLDPVLASLAADRHLAVAHRRRSEAVRARPFALREANLDAFSAPEIAAVDRVIRDLWGQSRREVGRRLEDDLAWRLAEPCETIPYELALVDVGEATDEDLEYARQLEQQGR